MFGKRADTKPKAPDPAIKAWGEEILERRKAAADDMARFTPEEKGILIEFEAASEHISDLLALQFRQSSGTLAPAVQHTADQRLLTVVHIEIAHQRKFDAGVAMRNMLTAKGLLKPSELDSSGANNSASSSTP